MTAPSGYSKLPEGAVCKCPKMWREADGSHWCCQPKKGSDIEQKCVFALSPEGTGDGVPLMIIGIPAGAWDNLKDGKTSHFDLTKVGLPIKLMLFGAASHDAAMKVLQDGMKQRGEAYLDERRSDFAVDEFKTP